MTPAHSHIDLELSRRHNLPLVNILDDAGQLINVPQLFLVIFARFHCPKQQFIIVIVVSSVSLLKYNDTSDVLVVLVQLW